MSWAGWTCLLDGHSLCFFEQIPAARQSCRAGEAIRF